MDQGWFIDVHGGDSSWEQGLNCVERLCQDPLQSRVAMERVGVRSVVRDVEKDWQRGVLRVEPVRSAQTTAAGSQTSRLAAADLFEVYLRDLGGRGRIGFVALLEEGANASHLGGEDGSDVPPDTHADDPDLRPCRTESIATSLAVRPFSGSVHSRSHNALRC